MNPTLIITIERGCLLTAVANGSINVIVQDNDIPTTQRGHVGMFTPDVITIAEMTARVEALNNLSPVPSTIS